MDERPGLREALTEALRLSRASTVHWNALRDDEQADTLVNALGLATHTRDAQPSPAGPEELREGLRCLDCGARIADIECRDCGGRVGATIPAPDTGAEERLRVALDELDGLRRDINNAVAGLTDGQRRFFVRRVDAARAALSGGSVDEERDSDV